MYSLSKSLFGQISMAAICLLFAVPATAQSPQEHKSKSEAVHPHSYLPPSAFDPAGAAASAATAAAAAQATANAALPAAGGTLTGTVTGGTLSGTAVSNANVTATGAPTSTTLAGLAAQQGVLLDSFKESGDPDDTQSLWRAVMAGMPILLGPRTYIINNFVAPTNSTATFILRGIPGVSVIQRTLATYSHFFDLEFTSNISIDGVIFDMNSANVTANQWGVYSSSTVAGQTIDIKNSTFENNSGTLGYCLTLIGGGPPAGGKFNLFHNEATNCSKNAVWLASVSNGTVNDLYSHDNASSGLYISSYTSPTSTVFAYNILVTSSRFFNNAGGGVGVGGFAPPYSFALPSAVYVAVRNSTFVDNGGSTKYQLYLQGDYLTATDLDFSESAPIVPLGGIDCNGTHSQIKHNTFHLPNASYGIDCGGSASPIIEDNTLVMTTGNAIDVGGTQNALVSGNWFSLSGSAHGSDVENVEADGSGYAFPNLTSGLVIERNTFNLSGGSTEGVELFDNAGGTSGAVPSIIKNNSFTATSGASASQDINWYGLAYSVVIQDNYHNGLQNMYTDPGPDLVYYPVFDEVRTTSLTTAIRAIIPQQVSTYNAGGSILYVWPTTGGSNYVQATTTLAASGTGGGSGWTGTAQINNGVIIGVHTLTYGSGYSGTVSVTATDSGGGSGAVLSVGRIPTLPAYKRMRFVANASPGNLLQSTGGAIGITGGVAPFFSPQYTVVNLEALSSGLYWTVQGSAAPASFAVGSLPTCASSYNGVTVVVTGSSTNKWHARCNGSNWLWADGSTVSG